VNIRATEDEMAESSWRWPWFAAIGGALGGVIGAMIAQVVTVGWLRPAVVGLVAGIGTVLGMAFESRRRGPGSPT
jgi:hypothetical protein